MSPRHHMPAGYKLFSNMFRPFAITLIVLFISIQLVNVSAQEVFIDQPLAVLETDDSLNQLAWHPDEKILAVASDDGIKIYTDRLQLVTSLLPGVFVRSLSWSPDGQQLAITNGATIEIWDWDSSANTFSQSEILQGTNLQVTVTWSPDGERLASFDAYYHLETLQGYIQIWDTITWQMERQIDDLYSPSFNEPTGGLLAWDPNDSSKLGGIGYRIAERNGEYVVAAGPMIFTLNTEKGVRLQEIELGLLNVTSIAWQPTGNWVAVSTDGVALVYNISTSERILNFPHGETRSTDWSPNGRYLLDGRAVSDTLTEHDLGLFDHRRKSWSVDWNPDGLRLAVGNYDGSIYIEDATLLPGFVPTPSPTPTLSITPTAN